MKEKNDLKTTQKKQLNKLYIYVLHCRTSFLRYNM